MRRYIKPREVIKLVAEMILDDRHSCSPECLCWKLLRVPAIDDALRRLHVRKLQGVAADDKPTHLNRGAAAR